VSGRRGDAPLVGRYLVSRKRSKEDHALGGEDEGALPSRMAAGDDAFMARVRSRPAKVRVDRRGLEPYDVRFSIRRPIVPSGDVDDFIVHVRGEIVCVDGETEEVAGSVDAYVLQVDRAREAGEDVWGICDATSANLFEVCEAVFDEAGELKDEVCDAGIGSPRPTRTFSAATNEHQAKP